MAFIVWLDEALKEVLIYLFIQSFVDLQSENGQCSHGALLILDSRVISSSSIHVMISRVVKRWQNTLSHRPQPA